MPKKFKLNDLGNPLLAGYDLGYNVIGPAIAGKGRNDDIIRPIVKDIGKYVNPLTIVGVGSGKGLFAQGGGLYAQQRNVKGRGNGMKKKLKKKIEADVNSMLPNRIPPSFRGGALKRNTQHANAGILGVGGTLLSNNEMHPAMVSRPYAQDFNQIKQLPPQFHKYHIS